MVVIALITYVYTIAFLQQFVWKMNKSHKIIKSFILSASVTIPWPVSQAQSYSPLLTPDISQTHLKNILPHYFSPAEDNL